MSSKRNKNSGVSSSKRKQNRCLGVSALQKDSKTDVLGVSALQKHSKTDVLAVGFSSSKSAWVAKLRLCRGHRLTRLLRCSMTSARRPGAWAFGVASWGPWHPTSPSEKLLDPLKTPQRSLLGGGNIVVPEDSTTDHR